MERDRPISALRCVCANATVITLGTAQVPYLNKDSEHKYSISKTVFLQDRFFNMGLRHPVNVTWQTAQFLPGSKVLSRDIWSLIAEECHWRPGQLANRIIPKDLCKQQRTNTKEKPVLASPLSHQILLPYDSCGLK